jgi:hypothetical protein
MWRLVARSPRRKVAELTRCLEGIAATLAAFLGEPGLKRDRVNPLEHRIRAETHAALDAMVAMLKDDRIAAACTPCLSRMTHSTRNKRNHHKEHGFSAPNLT